MVSATFDPHRPERLASDSPSPAALFSGLRSEPGVAFLDGRAAVARAPLSHVAWLPRNQRRIDADTTRRETGDERAALAAIESFLADETAAGRAVIGAIAYELGRIIEPTSGRAGAPHAPLAWLASYDHVYTYDHRIDRWCCAPPVRRVGASRAPYRMGPLEPTVAFADYARSYDRALGWIEAGDVYQVNLSIGFEAPFHGDPASLFERIASRHPAPYAAYVDTGDLQLLGISPELFLERRGDRLATRPIKGTRPRGADVPEDHARRDELAADPKERAEHVMIVDLERNDLGRIARVGTVHAQELGSVETYPGLHHLESTVTARIAPGLSFGDILRATFPSGSITGAPKIRAMQIIEELEDAPRGFYTGGIFHHAPNGDFTMSVAIRTATVSRSTIRYRAGGGLVWDSRPDREYAECLLKARAFTEAANA